MSLPIRYKRCPDCGVYTEGIPGQLNNYCPAHIDKFQITLKRGLNARFISISEFDLYEKDGDRYYRVCRYCGGSLLTKTGKHHKSAVRCRGKHQFPAIELPYYDWGSVSFTYLRKMETSQQYRKVGAICQQLKSLNTHPTVSVWPDYKYRFQNYYFCEECGELVDRHDIEIHHKIPVALLDETNWQLCFDPNNLIGLCKSCHHTKHGEIWEARRKNPLPSPVVAKNKLITDFFT